MADRKEPKASSRVKEKKERKEGEKKERKEGKKKEEKPPPPAPQPKKEEEKKAEDEQKDQKEKKEEKAENGELKVEPMELPPFEIISGERFSPFFFKFQFKNVEYSSGRNKTFLCYLVDVQGVNGGAAAAEGNTLRGYMEDEHISGHAEEAFFHQVLPEYDPQRRYLVTWYVSSSPCAACAAKLAEILRQRPTMRLKLMAARLFMWEEPEVQDGLRRLSAAGCKLRVMKPTDFQYTWDTFVEPEDQSYVPWEDIQENYEFYEEKLSNILQ